MFATQWGLLRDTVQGFIDDNALSRGASIAFYTVTSLAPVLLIVVAIAALAFGQDAANDALAGELSGLVGKESATLLQEAAKSAAAPGRGAWATLIGVATLLVSASGVFGELQSTLNAIWGAKPQGTTLSRLIRARAASLGLVATLGFLLIVSLVISTLLTAFGSYLETHLPLGGLLLRLANLLVSMGLIALLFAAIYKVLPDTPLAWRDVAVGAVATSLLFTIGKTLIGWYLGSSAVASAYGAAGALFLVLLWIYYSAQIFLLGAEFTKAYAHRHGSKQNVTPKTDSPAAPRPASIPDHGRR